MTPTAGLFCVTGWLEHVDTRLKVSHDEEHMRTPTLAAFHGSRASNRKSSMQAWLLQELLADGNLPDESGNPAAFAQMAQSEDTETIYGISGGAASLPQKFQNATKQV